MAKGLIGGMTDYSHQSFQDVLSDLINERRHIINETEKVTNALSAVNDSGFWNAEVPFNVRGNIARAIKHYQTTIEEFNDIINGVQTQVEEHHVRRLKSIAATASEINKDIGVAWHQGYDAKDYGEKNFNIVEQMYFDARDIAVNLLDIDNVADRLKDFVGMKPALEKKAVLKKILFLTSSPDDQDKLRGDVEARKIDEMLQNNKYKDSIILIKKEAVMVETITLAMLNEKPQFVHFTGHGTEDGIAVETEDGISSIFPSAGLIKLFNLYKDTTEAVLLNACHTNNYAEAISKLGIYVIGMDDTIDEQAATDFAIGFYQAIGSGKDVPFAYQSGLVLISQHDYNQDTPVLWKNGEKVIFDLPGSD